MQDPRHGALARKWFAFQASNDRRRERKGPRGKIPVGGMIYSPQAGREYPREERMTPFAFRTHATSRTAPAPRATSFPHHSPPAPAPLATSLPTLPTASGSAAGGPPPPTDPGPQPEGQRAGVTAPVLPDEAPEPSPEGRSDLQKRSSRGVVSPFG